MKALLGRSYGDSINICDRLDRFFVSNHPFLPDLYGATLFSEVNCSRVTFKRLPLSSSNHQCVTPFSIFGKVPMVASLFPLLRFLRYFLVPLFDVCCDSWKCWLYIVTMLSEQLVKQQNSVSLGDVVLRFMDKSSQDDRRENVRFL